MRIVRTFPFQLIFVSTLLLLVAVLLVTALVLREYETTLVRQNEQMTLRSFATTEKNINRLLDTAYKAAVRIKQRPEVDAYLFGDFATQAQRVMAQRAMIHAIAEALADGYGLNGVLFFQDNGHMVGATEPWRFAYEVASHPFFESAQLASLPVEPRLTWLGGYRLADFTGYPATEARDDQLMIVGANRTRYSYSYTDQVQTITMVVSVSAAEVLHCFEYMTETREDVFLLDGEGRQLAAINLQALGATPWFFDTIDTQDSYGSTHVDGADGRFQVIYYRMPQTGWLLVKQIPYAVYTQQISRLRTVTMTTVSLVLLAALLLHLFWSMRFTRPLKQISGALERVRKGDLRVRMTKPSGIYEYELARTEFNRMIQSMEDLLVRTRDLEHERFTLELQNLQAKLNPHMIFNTITAIRWMATISGAQKVSDMLVELAELIRPFFTEWRLTWTLREELEHVRHYVKLLNLRYGAVFSLDLKVTDEMLSLSMPCFTLQPLLENSCEHGARPEEPIHITLEVDIVDALVMLRVKDNGRGMPPEKVAALAARLMGGEGGQEAMPIGHALGHSGIGLVNVHRRLRLSGGPACGLSIQSEMGVGTCIVVHLGSPPIGFI